MGILFVVAEKSGFWLRVGIAALIGQLDVTLLQQHVIRVEFLGRMVFQKLLKLFLQSLKANNTRGVSTKSFNWD